MSRLSALLVISLLFFGGPSAAEQVVINSETPRDGDFDIVLKQLWERGDYDDDIIFGVVPRLVPDEATGELYVLDSQLHEVLVFDENGEWLRTIGRRGEGPGEFQNPGDIFLSSSGHVGVMQVFPGRIVQIAQNGEPGAAFDPSQTEGFQVFYRGAGVGNRVLISGAIYGGDQDSRFQSDYLKSFSVTGEELAVLHQETKPVRFGNMTFKEETFTNFVRRWAVSKDGRVAIAPGFDAYRIEIKDLDGNLIQVIERPDYVGTKRTKKELARLQNMYEAFTRWNRGSKFEVSPTHQTIESMAFREDGSLWVMSAAHRWRSEEGVMATWDVYDADGNYAQRVHLRGDGDPVEDGLFFLGNRVYQVTDLFSASMSSAGGDAMGDEDDFSDVEPVRLVAWSMNPATSR